MVAVDELIQRMQGFAFWMVHQDLVSNNTIGLVYSKGKDLAVMFGVKGK